MIWLARFSSDEMLEPFRTGTRRCSPTEIEDGRDRAVSLEVASAREQTAPTELTGFRMMEGDAEGLLGPSLSESLLIVFGSAV